MARNAVGKHFSEGARQLRIEMDRRGWTAAELAEELGTTSGQVSHWLFGDRRASLQWSLAIERRLRIASRLWTLPAVQPIAPTGT